MEIKKAHAMRELLSCGDWTRTSDLQVMSLASYLLLHSAAIYLQGLVCTIVACICFIVDANVVPARVTTKSNSDFF